jgi:hypothetical protein
MVVGEHGVEEKVVVSREEVVAMAIPPQISVVWQRGEGEQHLLRRSSATHASELKHGDRGEQKDDTPAPHPSWPGLGLFGYGYYPFWKFGSLSKHYTRIGADQPGR